MVWVWSEQQSHFPLNTQSKILSIWNLFSSRYLRFILKQLFSNFYQCFQRRNWNKKKTNKPFQALALLLLVTESPWCYQYNYFCFKFVHATIFLFFYFYKVKKILLWNYRKSGLEEKRGSRRENKLYRERNQGN
jgi:hypothetical protein